VLRSRIRTIPNGLSFAKILSGCDFNRIRPCPSQARRASTRICMIDMFVLLARAILRLFCCRRRLLFENLALRQQLVALNPEGVPGRGSHYSINYCGTGFRLYWGLISKVRRPLGRRQTPKEVRELIFRMVAENPTWGAPRIHGELLMLGFDVSERTISRWMKRAPRDPEQGSKLYLSQDIVLQHPSGELAITMVDLCLAKMLALQRISNIRDALARRFVITHRHVQPVSALARRARSALPDAPRSAMRESRLGHHCRP